MVCLPELIRIKRADVIARQVETAVAEGIFSARSTWLGDGDSIAGIADCHEPRRLPARTGSQSGAHDFLASATAASLKGSGPLIYREPNGS